MTASVEKFYDIRPVEPVNNNLYMRKGEKGRQRLPDGWDRYKETAMTAFGPAGFLKSGFVYLDPEIAEWRGGAGLHEALLRNDMDVEKAVAELNAASAQKQIAGGVA